MSYQQSSTSGGPLVIQALACLGNAPYRVDWFGQAEHGGAHAYPAPKVMVELSKLDACRGATHRASDEHRATIGVPMALMPLLSIGNLLRNGQVVGTQAMECAKFDGFEVTDTSQEILPCGSMHSAPGSLSTHLLPFPAIDLHRQHTQSNVAVINLAPRTRLVIPCMELARFYFGASGKLMKALFSGTLVVEELWSHAHLRASDKVGEITLHPSLPGIAAPHVARLAFNSHALRQARAIVSSGTVAHRNRTPWYPRIAFPFEGKTDLVAEGHWIEGFGVRTFFAARIVSCSHPFPFERLFYRSNGGANRSIESPSEGGAAPQADTGSRRSRAGARALSSASFDPRLTPETVRRSSRDEDSFPDLRQKPVRRNKVDAVAARQSDGASSDSPQTLGAGSQAAGGLRGVEVTATNSHRELSSEQMQALQSLSLLRVDAQLELDRHAADSVLLSSADEHPSDLTDLSILSSWREESNGFWVLLHFKRVLEPQSRIATGYWLERDRLPKGSWLRRRAVECLVRNRSFDPKCRILASALRNWVLRAETASDAGEDGQSVTSSGTDNPTLASA